jgi:hypothetical protein
MQLQFGSISLLITKAFDLANAGGSGWLDEFVKNSPKIWPNPFLSKLMHNLNRGKK